MTQLLETGGSERQAVETACALRERGFEPAYGCMRCGGLLARPLAEAGVPLTEFPVRSFASAGFPSAVAALRRYLRETGVSVVHCFDSPSTVFAIPAARWAGVPVALTSQRGHRDLMPPIVRAGLRLTDRLADGMVVNCLAMRDHVVADAGWRPERVHLCYNGIDVERFSPGDPAQAGAAPLTIGVICKQRPEKDLATLVRAFAALARDNAEARLILVGSGPERPKLEALVTELGCAARTHFENETLEVVAWLRRIDIFVLPSLSEAFSNSIMEAMACGCAVVASRVGGNPELVEPGETGELFPAGDSPALAAQLQRLAADPVRRRAMQGAARRRIVERFSKKAAADRMAAIYRALLERRPVPAL